MAATTGRESSSSPIEPTNGIAGLGSWLRFTTAGSVDDGKSTLIGRLLYDSRSVYEDQLISVRDCGINHSAGEFDLALLTDGLRAEREQGITIDVAYRYFATPRRKFIIADTPGHEQYTRNMATGASTAHAAVVLVDATKGVLAQARRHAYIASLLGVQHLIAAINKMDLVDYSQEVFKRISDEFRVLAKQLSATSVYQVPLSALNGDNVVRRSLAMPWFDGPTLLEYLEELAIENDAEVKPVRFPIQHVTRPDSAFRGFAGELVAGVLRPGATLLALPSGITTRIKSIVTYDGELKQAGPGDAITVTIESEIDLSRGDMLVSEEGSPAAARQFNAKLVWMDSSALDPNRFYLLKHTTRLVRARLRLLNLIDIHSFSASSARTLGMNHIADVEVETALPVFADTYRQYRSTGSFILIDPISNATVAAGMISELREDVSDTRRSTAAKGKVTAEERKRRSGHPAAIIWINGGHGVAEFLERELFARGWNVHLIGPGEYRRQELSTVAKVLHASGTVGIFSALEPYEVRAAVRAAVPPGTFFEIAEKSLRNRDVTADVIAKLGAAHATSLKEKGSV